MALKVRSATDATKNYTDAAARGGGNYAKGVQGAGGTWLANTEAANATWKDGVSAAASRDAFSKGVAKAGAGKYQDKASSVGASRYPDGVRKGATYYQSAVQPYLDTIANLTLPARRPKGDPTNLARVAAVAQALRAKKIGG
jgi:hypothetical protein